MPVLLKERALANKIRGLKEGDCPYTLFLGAGASRSSGIDLANELVFKWKEKLFEDLTERDPAYHQLSFDDWNMDFETFRSRIRSGGSPEHPTYHEWKEQNDNIGEGDYSLLFSMLHQTRKERQLFIEQIVEDTKPTFGYLFLSGLIAKKKFNRVLTTNFDDLLSDALFKFYGIKPITCAFDSMISGIRIDSQRPKIIKLHGDFLFDNLRNIRNELRSLDANIEDKMFEMCKDRGLIVVGYSGNDQSVMDPMQEMLRKDGYLEMGVHWCFLDAEVNHENDIPKRLQELKKQYSSKIFFYQIKSFDNLMEIMFRECGCDLPAVLEKPSRVNIIKEFQSSVTASTRAVDLSAYQAECLHRFLKENLEKKPSDEDLQYVAENYFAMGKRYRDEGSALHKVNVKSSTEMFEKSFEQYESCLEIITSYLGRNEAAPEDANSRQIYVYALKRLTGLYIALSKVEERINGANEQSKQYLDRSIETVEKGVALHTSKLSKKEVDKYKSDIASFYYNGCCALSLRSRHNRRIPQETKDLVFKYMENDVALFPDKSHLAKIVGDNDFIYFKQKNSVDIQNKFGLLGETK